jgi:hypothetical protein
LPQTRYEATKYLHDMNVSNLSMVKIHACVDDCCIYYDELKDAQVCPDCDKSKYKDVNKKNPLENLDTLFNYSLNTSYVLE